MSSKKKSNEVVETLQSNEQKYPTSLLVKSEALRQYGLHFDVVRAILNNSEYTMTEAKKAIQKYLNTFK